jgi:NADH:ubiquinone oxidoreductase subunit 5 (subunit L)/multisubunit Na+/H+ antiporter MnhA subunit
LKKSWLGNRIYNFLNRKWFFDKVYVEVFGQNFLSFAFHGSYKVIDRGLIEFFGPAGLSFSVYKNSLFLSYFQSGFLYHYSFLMLIGLSFILIFFQIWNFLFSFFSIKLLFILFFSIFFI